jgi:FemAB-related protein (PEP-CTERM system-associated)
MIQIKQLDSTHEGMWDEYVNTSAEATPYHRFAWGQAVKDSYGFDTHYLGAFDDGSTGEATLVGVLPLIKMKAPLGKPYYVSLPYCDCAGIIADNNDIATLLHHYATEHLSVKEETHLLLRQGTYDFCKTEDIAESAKVRMILSLAPSVDEQMAAFKSKLRSQIRKAEKNGLTSVTTQYSNSDAFKLQFEGFYNVMSRNMKALGSPVHSKAWFYEILKHYGANAFLAIVYKDSAIVGAAIVIMNDDRASIPWASTLSEYNRLAPNMLLYWSVLSESIQKGMKSFDFGRSTLNEGTYKFKKQWGCEPTELEWTELARGQIIQNEDMQKSKARAIVEQVWCKTPLAVTNYLGPRLRKYISL